MEPTAAVVVPQPVPVPQAPMSLRDHIATEEPARAPVALAAPAPVDATPDPDVEANPELAQEIDALEPPPATETPQEKAARTKRQKASAQKGLVSRLANQRDKERTRAATLERELTELRQRHPAPPAAAPAATQPAQAAAPVYDGSEPNDPEPTLETFADKSDPYVEWTKARTDWAARREVRKAQHTGRQESMAARAHHQRTEALRAFDTHATELRKTEPGFDAAIEHLTLTGPMQAVIFGSGELGPRLALSLANDPALHQRLLSLPPALQYVELGALKATVETARTKAATPAPPITSAPPPPSTTLGAGVTATDPDTRAGVPLKDHIRIEEAELADRRKRGYRY